MRELSGGKLEILTFKEGLLSGVAHDLMLRVNRFVVHTDGQRVEALFHLNSLAVEGVMRDGKLDPTKLSDSDRDEILKNTFSKVLHTDRHPEATFEAAVDADANHRKLTGTLALHDHREPIEVEVREQAGMWQGEIELQPSRFGIPPFKALLGAIKLQDRVVVRFRIPIVPL